ncbi:hypothetical protein Bccel_1071 [Pseudobacteroides cellulosolvens ATCC 35603 = DSM 2933]|uniref:Type 4 fimbrial biogenesis protein PilX, N-terminal domain containing protein n=3 Tax=Pseudobacteroides cellulosolvens TaxID=35825 RepID=A0A0L6JIY0_9FIRM|nr:hypothetical protein Bccel_1071 [Pseudobacteroides cellulosolvens ATCC 35603 = DSM 2933]
MMYMYMEFMKTKNKKGAVFIIVSIVLSIILIILSTLLALITTEVKLSQTYADGLKAYYICHSSVNFAYDYILQHRDVPLGHSEVKSNSDNIFPTMDYVKSYTSKWEVMENNSSLTYRIISTGVYGKYTRKIMAAFEVDEDNKIKVTEWRLIDP